MPAAVAAADDAAVVDAWLVHGGGADAGPLPFGCRPGQHDDGNGLLLLCDRKWAPDLLTKQPSAPKEIRA